MNFRGSGRSRRDEPTIDITPLIDVIFQFLIFFVLTSTFAYDSGFVVDIPKAKAGTPGAAQSDLVVAVDREGTILFEGKPRSKAELEGLLAERAGGGRGRAGTVVVQADGEIHHSRVVEVMDAIQAAGFKSIAIATSPDTR